MSTKFKKLNKESVKELALVLGVSKKAIKHVVEELQSRYILCYEDDLGWYLWSGDKFEEISL